MNPSLKYASCPKCGGTGRHKSAFAVQITIPKDGPAVMADAPEDFANECPRCSGSGSVALPPYGDGSTAKISQEKMSELADAASLLRCMGHRIFIEGIANQAASITLPEEVIAQYEAYWVDPKRDVTLGGYINQIAEYAEQLAMKVYGSLDNDMYAFARPHDAPTAH